MLSPSALAQTPQTVRETSQSPQMCPQLSLQEVVVTSVSEASLSTGTTRLETAARASGPSGVVPPQRSLMRLMPQLISLQSCCAESLRPQLLGLMQLLRLMQLLLPSEQPPSPQPSSQHHASRIQPKSSSSAGAAHPTPAALHEPPLATLQQMSEVDLRSWQDSWHAADPTPAALHESPLATLQHASEVDPRRLRSWLHRQERRRWAEQRCQSLRLSHLEKDQPHQPLRP